jgi:cytochrome b561
MVQNGLQPTEKSPEQAATGKTSRLFFIDHLRAALVILVVLHHVAMVYGVIPPFYYWEPPTNDPLAGLIFLVFVLFNQAWFMGAFFLLAGYFTPGSYDRKGPGSFLKARLLRLGIPLILFIFVLNPISSIGYFLMPASVSGNTTPLSWQLYPNLIGTGPLWFVAMLLIFGFGYAAWRMLTRKGTSTSMSESSLPGYLGIGIFILALALVRYHRIPPQLVPNVAPLYEQSRLCGSADSYGHIVLDWVSQLLKSDRGWLPANTSLRLRDMAVCRIHALGLHLCSRNMPGLDPTLPPLLQRAGRVRQVPDST